MIKITAKNGNAVFPLESFVTEGSITEGVNEFSSFAFTLIKCEFYDLIFPQKTHIEVFDEGNILFSGRVLAVTPSMTRGGFISKQIVCEDKKAYLCDSVQPYISPRNYEGDESKSGLYEFVELLLTNHNAGVEDYKKIYPGIIDTETHETNNNVYKGLNYQSTWEAIKTKLLDVYGGEIGLRKENGTLYLDYRNRLGTRRATKIKVGVNMQSAEYKIDATNVVSRLIPLGAKKTEIVINEDGKETEQETEDRITIESVNDDVIYIESETALQLFGIQTKTVIWDDVHEPSILKQRGLQYLAEQNTALASHNVAAVDLSRLGITADKLNLHDIYPVENPFLNFNDELEIVKKVTNIKSPATPTLTFGNKNIYLSQIYIDDAAKIDEIKNSVSENDTETKNKINEVIGYISETRTAIEQTAENITLEAEKNTVSKTEYDTFAETVKNILQIDPDGTTMLFQRLTEEISAVNENAQTQYQSILKYIRFENGNIILGEVNNPITLTLENDILSFKQNGKVVAYFSNNKLNVTDGEFLNSLLIGDFGFKPRANGNLSFGKMR